MTETEKKEAAQSSIRAAEVCFVIKEKLSQEMLGIDLNDGLLNILSSPKRTRAGGKHSDWGAGNARLLELQGCLSR
jgi:hypothetical protein